MPPNSSRPEAPLPRWWSSRSPPGRNLRREDRPTAQSRACQPSPPGTSRPGPRTRARITTAAGPIAGSPTTSTKCSARPVRARVSSPTTTAYPDTPPTAGSAAPARKMRQPTSPVWPLRGKSPEDSAVCANRFRIDAIFDVPTRVSHRRNIHRRAARRRAAAARPRHQARPETLGVEFSTARTVEPARPPLCLTAQIVSTPCPAGNGGL